jgi:hypothetical protein
LSRRNYALVSPAAGETTTILEKLSLLSPKLEKLTSLFMLSPNQKLEKLRAGPTGVRPFTIFII